MHRIIRAVLLGGMTISVIAAAGSASAEPKFERNRGAIAAAISSLKKATDPNISGYVTDEGPVKSASASVKVPGVLCSSEEKQVLFLGLEGINVAADVVIDCEGGFPTYTLEAFTFDAGADTSTEVKPGDVVKLSITQSPTETTVTAHNGDVKVSVTSSPEPESSLIFGTLNLAQTTPPQFTTAKFTKSKFNGKTLSAKKAAKVNRVDGSTKIKTGKLKDGAFTQTFEFLN